MIWGDIPLFSETPISIQYLNLTFGASGVLTLWTSASCRFVRADGRDFRGKTSSSSSFAAASAAEGKRVSWNARFDQSQVVVSTYF